MNTKPTSLYCHIPFCDHICAYCGFTRFLYQDKLADQYCDKLIQQIAELPAGLKTIYVGGGTPTSLTPEQLDRLFSALAFKLDRCSDYEFTVEGNPESIAEERIAVLAKHGVNRMSMGVQCAQDPFLAQIGRNHTFKDVIIAAEILKKHGISNYSMDLMYGFPEQTLAELVESMDAILRLDPNHISLYSLTIEDNSLFGKRGVEPVDSDMETAMYLKAIEYLETNGYQHYEISNFAKPGFQSKHNKVYWHYQPYYALGVGASRMINHRRQTYTKDIRKYMKEDVFSEDIMLSKDDEMFEFIMMGLRLKEGISKREFLNRFNVSIHDVYNDALLQCKEKHLLIEAEDVITTTFEGFIMLFDTLLYFMED